jgi:hypothetical protein
MDRWVTLSPDLQQLAQDMEKELNAQVSKTVGDRKVPGERGSATCAVSIGADGKPVVTCSVTV